MGDTLIWSNPPFVYEGRSMAPAPACAEVLPQDRWQKPGDVWPLRWQWRCHDDMRRMRSWDIPPKKQVLMTLMRNIAVKSGVYHCHPLNGEQLNMGIWPREHHSPALSYAPRPQACEVGRKRFLQHQTSTPQISSLWTLLRLFEANREVSEDCRMAAWLCAFTGSNVEQVPKIILSDNRIKHH